MHEFRLCDDNSRGAPIFQGPFALCRVMKRNELTKEVGSTANGVIIEPLVPQTRRPLCVTRVVYRVLFCLMRKRLL
ncbi:hypothetical protein HanIR_Chr13g0657681 [Helianthus annuus]|nr:hypothetical protein HanIR_Chr13g0657681 [Helianthus annuus]